MIAGRAALFQRLSLGMHRCYVARPSVNGNMIHYCVQVTNYETSTPSADSSQPAILSAARLAESLDIPSVHPAGLPDEHRVRCYNCGQIGHMSYDCRQPQVRKACYTCGLTGHLARECPKGRKPIFCFACRQPGHMSFDCPTRSSSTGRPGGSGQAGTPESIDSHTQE